MTTEILIVITAIATVIGTTIATAKFLGISPKGKWTQIWRGVKAPWRWIQRISRERQARAEYLDLALQILKITSAIEESLRKNHRLYRLQRQNEKLSPELDAIEGLELEKRENLQLQDYGESIEQIKEYKHELHNIMLKIQSGSWKGLPKESGKYKKKA